MERKWYYAVDGVRHGPVTVEELRALVGSGAVRPSDLVWHPDFGPEWRRAEEVGTGADAPPQPDAGPVVMPSRVPTEGVAGSPPSCLEAAAQACARVVAVLFKPFDITRWFSMGFCAWLAYIGTMSGNFGGANGEKKETAKHQVDAVLDKLANLSDHPGLVALGASILVFSLLLALWMCSLRSRGDFMFLHRWYRPDAQILQGWSASRASGHALFVWRIKFFLVSLVLFAAVGAVAVFQIALPYMEAGKTWSAELARPSVICVTAAVLLMAGVGVVAHLAKAFVVPVMYWHDVSVAKAWRTVFDLCNQYPLAVLAYLFFVTVFWFAASVGILVFGFCTCCVGFIPLLLPYFNAVALLPVLLFFRGFPVCFLSRWRKELVPDAA